MIDYVEFQDSTVLLSENSIASNAKSRFCTSTQNHTLTLKSVLLPYVSKLYNFVTSNKIYPMENIPKLEVLKFKIGDSLP